MSVSVTDTSGGASPGWPGALRAVAGDIKLAHTVFALPFAVLSAFLAAAWADRLPSALEGALVLACMVAARTYAMAANRLLDARIDAQNPRTAGRAIPAGRVSTKQMGVVCAGSALALCAGAAGFGWLGGNWWPLAASPVVLVVLGVYPLMKRSTSWCHAVLGLALGLSPLAAALAIEPGYLREPGVWLLASFVLLWVAGFDVLYALLDIDFDRGAGVWSLPARLGPRGAVAVSRAMHAAAGGVLWACWWVSPGLGRVFAVGAGVVCVVLVVEQSLVRVGAGSAGKASGGASGGGAPPWLFTANGFVSLALGIAGLVDVLRLG
ncbi:MAG: 4-hydroxybenzoate octaprenyltransferase [Planctomycetota bacterium]